MMCNHKDLAVIAVIDDGINERLYNLGQLADNVEITSQLAVQNRLNYDPFKPSHGTTCAAIIRKYVPEAVLSSVKILNDDTKKGLKDQLIKAIEWCVQNNIRIANLSLGTIDFRDFTDLANCIKYAVGEGLVIVAACNNRNIYTCPASLTDVIGVKCDKSNILGEGKYMYNTFAPDGIEIIACAGHSIADYTGRVRNTSACNSFAAPLVTAAVYNIIKDVHGMALDEIREQLYINSFKIPEDVSAAYPVQALNREIEVPVIAIYDYSYGKSIEIADMLTVLFKREGYNAASTADESIFIDGANEIIPLKTYSKAKSIQPENLSSLYAVYDPDIIIACIDALSKDTAYFEYIENSLNIDIGIFVLGDDIDEKHLYKVHGENILLTCSEGMNIDRQENMEVFSYSDKTSVYRVYKYIRSLFYV